MPSRGLKISGGEGRKEREVVSYKTTPVERTRNLRENARKRTGYFVLAQRKGKKRNVATCFAFILSSTHAQNPRSR